MVEADKQIENRKWPWSSVVEINRLRHHRVRPIQRLSMIVLNEVLLVKVK